MPHEQSAHKHQEGLANTLRLYSIHQEMPIEMWYAGWKDRSYSTESLIEHFFEAASILPNDYEGIEVMNGGRTAGQKIVIGCASDKLASRLGADVALVLPRDVRHMMAASDSSVTVQKRVGLANLWDDKTFSEAYVTDLWKAIPENLLETFLEETMRIADQVYLIDSHGFDAECLPLPASRAIPERFVARPVLEYPTYSVIRLMRAA